VRLTEEVDDRNKERVPDGEEKEATPRGGGEGRRSELDDGEAASWQGRGRRRWKGVVTGESQHRRQSTASSRERKSARE
jgi:hypothetical protein